MMVVMALASCGGAAKTHGNGATPTAMPIAPAPVAQNPATTPPAEPAKPAPAEPEKVAIAEDPDAGGQVTDPDDGGEATGSSSGMGGLGTRGSGAGGGGGIGAGYGGMRSREQTVPTVRWGTPTVKGALDPMIVKRIFRGHQNELRFCYEAQLQKNPNLQGLVVLKIVIDAGGKVTTATSSGVSKEIEACVTNRVRTWEFPKPQKGIVIVSQPITFAVPGR